MRSLAFSVFCFARWKSSGDEFHHNVNILNINWTPQLKIARMVNLMFFHNSKMLNFKKYLFLFISLAAPGLTCGTQDLFFFPLLLSVVKGGEEKEKQKTVRILWGWHALCQLGRSMEDMDQQSHPLGHKQKIADCHFMLKNKAKFMKTQLHPQRGASPVAQR